MIRFVFWLSGFVVIFDGVLVVLSLGRWHPVTSMEFILWALNKMARED